MLAAHEWSLSLSLSIRVSDYMDLTPVDVVGRRCYQVVHAEDVEGIRQSHLDCEYIT